MAADRIQHRLSKKRHWIYYLCCSRSIECCCCASARRGCEAAYALSRPWKMSIALLLGILVGFASFYASPISRRRAVTYAAKWVSYPGTMFLSIMKAVDLPLIACNVMVGISGLAKLSAAGRVGTLTGLWYLVVALTASSVGIGAYFTVHQQLEVMYDDGTIAFVDIALSCGSPPSSFLALETDGRTVTCSNATSAADSVMRATFFGDAIAVLAAPALDPAGVIKFIFDAFTPHNMVDAFASSNVLGILSISIILGLAIVQIKPAAGQPRNIFADLVMQIREVMTVIATAGMNWLGPLAVFSLTAGAFMGCHDPLHLLFDYLWLVVGLAVGFAVFSLIVMPLFFVIFVTGQNPFRYLALFRAQIARLVSHGHLDGACPPRACASRNLVATSKTYAFTCALARLLPRT